MLKKKAQIPVTPIILIGVGILMSIIVIIVVSKVLITNNICPIAVTELDPPCTPTMTKINDTPWSIVVLLTSAAPALLFGYIGIKEMIKI